MRLTRLPLPFCYSSELYRTRRRHRKSGSGSGKSRRLFPQYHVVSDHIIQAEKMYIPSTLTIDGHPFVHIHIFRWGHDCLETSLD